MIDIREKPQKVERAYLIGVQLPNQEKEEAEELLDELEELASTFGVETVGKTIIKISKTQAITMSF